MEHSGPEMERIGKDMENTGQDPKRWTSRDGKDRDSIGKDDMIIMIKTNLIFENNGNIQYIYLYIYI